jgi:two-component system phosphate regulon sensor histidine kinase PhoR
VKNREVERTAELAELLLEVARQLGETLDPDRIYDRFHELLAGMIPHDGVVVSSYDERDGLIRCDYAWAGGNRIDPTTLPPVPLNRKGGGMQSRVIVSGESLLENDVPERVQEPGGTYYNVDAEGTIRKLPDSGQAGTRAAMMVPVKHEGRVVGVVQLMRDSGVYSRQDVSVFEGLVAQLAAAVRNAHLQKEQRRLEAREAAARAVAAEREQAAHVLDAVGDGIFLVDPEGIVRLWNHAAELLTSLRTDRVRDRPVSEAFREWDALADRIPVAEGGAPASSVTLPVEVAGLELWLSFVAVRSPEGVVYAFRDLTLERRLEEEKREFIATISHELRTPMAAVYGAAETLLRRDIELAPETSRDLLEMIVRQAARLSQITEEILLASRLDRGELTVERHSVDLADLTRETVDAMRSQFPESVSLDLELGSEVRTALGDANRIQQVLVNLLDNAVKYGGEGPVTVRVETVNGYVRITVSDSGPGITFAEQRLIFEKFYRADPQHTKAPGGTGLGLYISRELAQRMGGRVGVRSAPGSGATFFVELPQA